MKTFFQWMFVIVAVAAIAYGVRQSYKRLYMHELIGNAACENHNCNAW